MNAIAGSCVFARAHVSLERDETILGRVPSLETPSGWTALSPIGKVLRRRVIIILLSPIVNDQTNQREGNNMQ